MARVLVIEDEPLIGLLLSEWLVEQGHEPIGPITNVVGGLKRVVDKDFDAAILDVNLGRLSSYPIADALIALGIPFVFATGLSVNAVDPRFSDTPTIVKPYTYEAVEKTVAALLKHALVPISP